MPSPFGIFIIFISLANKDLSGLPNEHILLSSLIQLGIFSYIIWPANAKF